MNGEIMRAVALGLADGQLEQADHALCRHADGWTNREKRYRLRPPVGYRTDGSELVRALLHMRSACRWMQAIV